jgi:hypothetical protein
MRKISLFAVCPECGAAARLEACWSCNGTAVIGASNQADHRSASLTPGQTPVDISDVVA